MIVPLRFVVEPLNDPEVDVLTNSGPRLVRETPTFSIQAVIYDTEREQVRSYDFHTVVDRTRPLGTEIGLVVQSPLETNLDLLRGLRDQLDRVLEEHGA